MQLLDVNATLIESMGELAIKRTQTITDEFLEDLNDARHDSISTPAGEFHRVCAVPAYLVESWMRQGFNVYEQPAAEVIKRLRLEGCDKFIATNKRI